MFGMFSEAQNLYKKGAEVLGSYDVVSGFLGHMLGLNVSAPLATALLITLSSYSEAVRASKGHTPCRPQDSSCSSYAITPGKI